MYTLHYARRCLPAFLLRLVVCKALLGKSKDSSVLLVIKLLESLLEGKQPDTEDLSSLRTKGSVRIACKKIERALMDISVDKISVLRSEGGVKRDLQAGLLEYLAKRGLGLGLTVLHMSLGKAVVSGAVLYDNIMTAAAPHSPYDGTARALLYVALGTQNTADVWRMHVLMQATP